MLYTINPFFLVIILYCKSFGFWLGNWNIWGTRCVPFMIMRYKWIQILSENWLFPDARLELWDSQIQLNSPPSSLTNDSSIYQHFVEHFKSLQASLCQKKQHMCKRRRKIAKSIKCGLRTMKLCSYLTSPWVFISSSLGY